MSRGPAPTPAVVRFLRKVDRSGDCWQWLGATQAGGYGRFKGEGKSLVLAHRWSFEHYVGPIPADMTIDHLCRNTSCVNPAHLEVVTREENSLRGSRNAIKTHCDHGHALTAENVYRSPSRPHARDCRTCRRERNAAAYLARKNAA